MSFAFPRLTHLSPPIVDMEGGIGGLWRRGGGSVKAEPAD